MKACGGPPEERTAWLVSIVFTVGVGLKVTERRISGLCVLPAAGSEVEDRRGWVSVFWELDAIWACAA